MQSAIVRALGFVCIVLALGRCCWSQTGHLNRDPMPKFLQNGAWKTQTVEQLNGKSPRIKTAAGLQIITQPWDMGAVYYPYMVYMPEKDRLLMLLGFGQDIKAGLVSSDDHGATWTKPKKIGDGWGIDLTYLGAGEAVIKRRKDNRYWFTSDFGSTWDRSVPVPPCQDGKLFYEDSPFFVDRDSETGRATRLWATGKKSDLACLFRTSDDRGKTWSECRHVPQWGRTGEIVLHRANNGNLVAACRVNLPQFAGQIDHLSGLGVSVSKDNGLTWSELNILYAWGRHLTSMVTLDNGHIVMTYIVRKGYVETPDGFPQFGVEAVISRDHGLTWDLDHRYLLAAWQGNRKSSEPKSWQASPQRTATVLLPDGSLLTAFGTGYRTLGNQGKRTHSPQDIAIVRWNVGDAKLDDDRTIANAPADSKLRNVFDPKVSKYAMKAAMKIGGQKQLFVDDYIIEKMESVSQVLNPVTKHSANPLIRPDRLWEQEPVANNKDLGIIFMYGSVIHDEQDDLFKMWYWSHGLVAGCYATSPDGLNWHKPELNLVDFRGSKLNNCINWRAMGMIHSPQDSDPDKRFKSLAGRRGAFSPDGLRWEAPPQSKAIPGDVASDNVIPFCYDELSGRYVAFPKVVRKSGGHLRRSVSVSFSKDFLNWTPAETILVPDERDDELARQRVKLQRANVEFDDGPKWHLAQHYGHCAFPYEGMYLGMLWVFDISGFGPRLVERSGRRPAAGGEDGVSNVELTSSRDLLHWQRVGNRELFIPAGKAGSWDGGRLYTVNRPVIVGDEIWIYYGGFQTSHGGQWHSADWKAKHRGSGIGLAKLRLDGWVSVDAGDKPGTLTTKPLIIEPDKKLVINVAAPKGTVAVEILNEAGKPLPGFRREECHVFSGDAIRHTVTWNEQSDLSQLIDKPVRLRFYLKDAKLFSFTLSEKTSR